MVMHIRQSKVLTLSPFSGLGMEVIWIQSAWFFQAFQERPDVVHLVSEYSVSCHVGQIAELHVQCAEFREYTSTSARPTVVLACLHKVLH